MTPSERKALKELVSAGMDIESGAASLSISMDSIRKSGKRFAAELQECFKAGTARLRGRVLRTALSEDDTKMISSLLEQRELSASSPKVIQVIERVVIDMPKPCEVCGHKPAPYPGNGVSTKKLSDRRGGIEPQDDLAGKS